MIYTKDEETELVKANLDVFENRLPLKCSTLLLKKVLRIKQHGLFFSLCNPAIYPSLLEAIKSIKGYDKANFFPKTINKLTNSFSHIDQQAAVAEIVVVGYYCKKFLGHPDVLVNWERTIPTSGKRMDVTLVYKNEFINIEVTAKDKDKRIRDFNELRYKVKVAIELRIENFTTQKFCYIFNIFTEEKDGEQFASEFTESHIKAFVEFISEIREKGEGKYYFIVGNKRLASVEIQKLNRLAREFASQIDMWSGFMKDDTRIKNRIVEKASNQLPKDDINFVYIPNLSGFDDIDFEEAFLGKEEWHLNKKGDVVAKTRSGNGAISIIKDCKYSPVCGLIYSDWDYSKKRIILNPLISCDEAIVKLIQ